MKTFTFLSLVIGIVFSVSSFAQNVPNGDFEEWETGVWDYETPVGWMNFAGMAGGQDVFKVSPGQSGDFAVELKPWQVTGMTSYTLATLTTSFPVDEQFGNLSGYVKGAAVGTDTLSILLVMFKDGSPVGGGIKQYTGEISEFEAFNATISYSEVGVPDSAAILITLGDFEGNGNEGSSYTIDGLELNGSAGIDDEPTFAILGNPYPNPANNLVNIPFELQGPNDVTLKVYDMQGRQVYSEIERSFAQGANEIAIGVDGYDAGIYFYTLSTGKNPMATRTFIVK
ncbi:MAG: hypothetical protein B6D64_01060 [Bacteroidetes bacterium 4484_276]|nr:MAG: hypothetical protein B6D64_01060 [Bacteroidetes bacterium 4484_276]